MSNLAQKLCASSWKLVNYKYIMKLENPKITILIGQEGTTIEVKDSKSSVTFLKVKLTPDQLSSALSRLSYTPCEAELFGLDRIGKTHENKYFDFEIPENLTSTQHKYKLEDLCLEALNSAGMSDWKSDGAYQSQDSFFKKEGKQYAKVIIRRWV